MRLENNYGSKNIAHESDQIERFRKHLSSKLDDKNQQVAFLSRRKFSNLKQPSSNKPINATANPSKEVQSLYAELAKQISL